MLQGLQKYRVPIIISVLFLIILAIFLMFKLKNNVSSTNNQLINNKVTEQINWIGHWKNEGKRELLVKEIANEFEFRNQEIKVNLAFPEDIYYKGGDEAEINFIIKTIQSPNPQWDIIRIKDYYSAIASRLNDPEWAKKYLVDFSQIPEFVAKHQPFLFSDNYKAQNGGITVGPYNEGSFYTLWFNKQVADKIGIKVKQFGMTPEDFISYIKAVRDYNTRNQTNILPMFEAGWFTSEFILQSMFFSLVGDLNEIKNTNYSPKKIENIEKILQYFGELSNYKPIANNWNTLDWYKQRTDILNGKCLFWVQGSWMYNIWDKDSANKVLLKNIWPAELPAYNGKSPCYIGGYKSCWAVPKNAPHRESAIKLLTYWSIPEVSEKWVRYTKCSSGIKGNLTSVSFGFDQFEDFIYTLDKQYGVERMYIAPDKAVYFGEKNKDIYLPIGDILTKKVLADDVIKSIRQQLR